MKYRKLPVEIEAITFDELSNHCDSSPVEGIDGKATACLCNGHRVFRYKDFFMIPTLEGCMQMNKGDMLIIGVNGEIYPCKIDIFEKTYEKAE